MGDILNYHASISILNIAALNVLCFIIRKNDLLSQRTKRFYISAIFLTMLVISAEFLCALFENSFTDSRTLAEISYIAVFSLSPFIPILIGKAFDNKFNCWVMILIIPSCLNAIFTLLSPIFDLVFTISDNTFSRGPLFVFYIISYLLSMIYLLIKTLNATKGYQNKTRFDLISIFIFLFVGTIFQHLFYSFLTVWVCISLFIIMYYVYYCDMILKYDALTGLLNRRAYESHINRITSDNQSAVILLDIDDFKNVNDCMGHQIGDRCLVTISENILASFSKLGLCYRIGGDEFCIVCKKADEEKLMAAISDFEKRMELSRYKENWLPTVSVGYSFHSSETDDIEATIRSADLCMFDYKIRRKDTKDRHRL